VNKYFYNLLLIPITLFAIMGLSVWIYWFTIPDIFDVGSMDLEQDYFYKEFVQDACRESRPEIDFDECQRSVIYGMSDRILTGGGFLTFLLGWSVPIFFIYVFPIRLILRKIWK
tara:strand:+ start:546 stop:887 length:342 start_codon:yes stop_codon:yes gene_type:complete